MPGIFGTGNIPARRSSNMRHDRDFEAAILGHGAVQERGFMSPRVTPAGSAFATYAPRMRRASFAVVPTRGKPPIWKGYRNWHHALGAESVAKWAEEVPDADIVYVPGLSPPNLRGAGIVLVDADDEPACEQVLEVSGDTPATVRTGRRRRDQPRTEAGRHVPP